MFIAGNVISSIFWGAVVAILLTLLVYLLCKQLNRVDSIFTWGILVILLLFAGFQSTMMIGALYTKDYIDDVNHFALALLPDKTKETQDAIDYKHIRHQIEEEFPVLKVIIDRIDTDGIEKYATNGQGIVNFITDEMKSTINYYILRRVCWLLGGVLLAMVSILLLNKPHDYTIDINNLEAIY